MLPQAAGGLDRRLSPAYAMDEAFETLQALHFRQPISPVMVQSSEFMAKPELPI
jgi:hypothetical protein